MLAAVLENLLLLGVLLTEVLGSIDHVGQRSLSLGPLTGLETAVGVDPELLRLEVLKHLLDLAPDLLLAGDTGRVNVVDTGTNVARVLVLNEDLEELGVGLGVLNGENVGIESGDGVEEVLELGVAEVRVDLGRVLDAGGGEPEGLDGPVEVSLALLAGAERKTLTESRLVDLDDIDASRLEVNNLVPQSKSKLLCLDGLVNVVTREGPPEDGDRSSKHTLDGGLGKRLSILGLLDGHGAGPGNVTDNDRGTDAARAIRLDPGVSGEDETVQLLTEVLNHVVSLGFTVDKDIEANLLLDLDVVLNFLVDEGLVVLGGDGSLGELCTGSANLGSLREGTNGGSGEEGELEVLLLSRKTDSEVVGTLVQLGGDLALALLDSGVIGAGRLLARLHGSSIGIELGPDRVGALSNSLGNDSNLLGLLNGKGEPVSNLSGELLLGSKSVGSVEEGRGGSDNDPVGAEGLDGLLNNLDGVLEVGLPDVPAVNDTSREDLAGSQSLDHIVQLAGSTDKVNVDASNVGKAGKNINIVDNVTEVGGNDQLGALAESSELGIGSLEGILGLLGQVEDEDGLVNLDGLGTSLGELDEELLVDGKELVEKRDGVDGGLAVGLAEVEEGDGADKDGAGLNALRLGLKVLADGLGVGRELEALVVGKGRTDIVVVAVEPLDHFLQFLLAYKGQLQ